jgi:hypothetical protein
LKDSTEILNAIGYRWNRKCANTCIEIIAACFKKRQRLLIEDSRLGGVDLPDFFGPIVTGEWR